jgi:hypothetical protein
MADETPEIDETYVQDLWTTIQSAFQSLAAEHLTSYAYHTIKDAFVPEGQRQHLAALELEKRGYLIRMSENPLMILWQPEHVEGRRPC